MSINSSVKNMTIEETVSVFENLSNKDLSLMEKSEVSKNLFADINWQEILRAGIFLTAKDHQMLEGAQNNLTVVLDNAADAQNYAKLLLKIADNCTSNVPVQQYVFTRVEEITRLSAEQSNGANNNAALFAADNGRANDGPFIRALHSADAYCRQSASAGLAHLLSRLAGDDKAFCLWIAEQLTAGAQSQSQTNSSALEHALAALVVLMRKRAARLVFLETGGVKLLTSVLTSIGPNGNAQHIYELCFALWTFSLSYTTKGEDFSQGPAGEEEVDFKVFLAAGTIPLLSELISAAPSRKVVRMCLACLRNLAQLGMDDILTEMLNVGIDKQLDVYINTNAHKAANDTDVESDAKQLQDTLLRNYRDLSTFDKWQSEMHSGALRWGIVHTEKFWRENARLMETGDFAPVKKIIGYLKSDNSMAVAIALYDLGEFTRFYPNGRSVTKSLGGKDLAMALIEHENVDVQRQALQCISKVMISNWDHMK